MAWVIQHEGAKEAVRSAVAAFSLGKTHLPPIQDGPMLIAQDPVDPDPADVACVDVALDALIKLIDKLPSTQNGCFVYASGDAGAVTILRVEGRAFTL